MTGAETIAAAITDAARILARALESPEWREDARSGPDAPGPVQTDPEGTEGAQSVIERAAQVLADFAARKGGGGNKSWRAAAQALADAGLLAAPRPMTVGQLTAEHIGKRVRVGDVIEFRPCEIEHYAAMSTSGERVLSERRTRIEDGGTQGKWTYSTDTPCEVLDD